MVYNLYDSEKHWQTHTLDGARKKAYSLIDGHPYRTCVFIYNDARYIGTVDWFRTVEDPKRNIYREHIVYTSGKNVWGISHDGTIYRTRFDKETIDWVLRRVAEKRGGFRPE